MKLRNSHVFRVIYIDLLYVLKKYTSKSMTEVF